ncbi:MAG: 1-acyl-sn-glycerol-3-phosphate acyltransferase, partial [Gammaproteobacteria bacterium]
MLLSIFNLTLRPILHLLAKWLFKLQVRGFENYHRSAKKTLIVCNHLSYLDGILLSLSLPADTAVAVYTHTQNAWYFRAITSLIPKFLISPERPFAIKNLIKEINQRNGRMLIFPEGQRSQTGTLMYAYPGTAMAALKTGADILPATIEGT